jgi:hypothetical protein
MLRSDMIGSLKYGTTRRGKHLPDSENRLQKQGSSDKIKMEDYKFPRNEVCAMPVLSVFFGIIVRMYHEQGGKHNMPHIHAEYSGKEVVVALDGTVLESEKEFPKNKLKLLVAWMEIHRDDLEANWKLLSSGEQFFRIDPLR